MSTEAIGSLIKQIRKSKSLTLQELAKKSGFSVGYISTLERDMSSPTLATLQSLCLALNITVMDLLSRLDNSKNLISKNERVVLFEEEDSVKIEALTDGKRNIKSICMTVMDSAIHTSDKHISDEFGYILEGSLMMNVEGVEYQLSVGDSLYIPQGSAHSFYKTSKENCVSIWVYHSNPTVHAVTSFNTIQI